MKPLLYRLLKVAIRSGFFCYFQKVRMHHMERVPSDRAVMLLPNHQNALLDPLLYAAYARGRKPYFLTRSDVFGNPFLRWVFTGLRMIPIYRLRDGRETLARNQEVFENCANLFSKGEHILLFPEANHNLRRQVRPLSKGFTRILAHSFQKYPGLDIWIVPVGVNYMQAASFPDRAAFYFGEAFPAKPYWDPLTGSLDVPALRGRVFDCLTSLTVHIDPEADYEESIRRLLRAEADLLDPEVVKKVLLPMEGNTALGKSRSNFALAAWETLFHLLIAPVWLPWRWIAKNKVMEPEFMSTFRFLFALIAMPLFYLIVGFVLSIWLSTAWCITSVLALFAFNLAYVKLRPVRNES